MSKIVSAIPNVCEGRDEAFIADLSARLRAIKNLAILDVSSDKTRNRTVFAFTGTKEAIFTGGMLLYDEAIKNIDMRKHKGEYPRIGALDVFPFVPLNNVTIEEAVDLSYEFAEKVVKRFDVPVYLYAEAARHDMRKDVEKVRACQYEGLEAQLKDPGWKPDMGPDTFKPDFGATIIGARYPIVSFKVFLNTDDMEVTKIISDAIQYETGGLRNVTSNAGMIYDTPGKSQIAVSISNHKKTPIYKVIEMIRIEARRYVLDVVGVETIGLVPESVLFDSAMYYMNMVNFSPERLLERTIQKHLDESDIFLT